MRRILLPVVAAGVLLLVGCFDRGLITELDIATDHFEIDGGKEFTWIPSADARFLLGKLTNAEPDTLVNLLGILVGPRPQRSDWAVLVQETPDSLILDWVGPDPASQWDDISEALNTKTGVMSIERGQCICKCPFAVVAGRDKDVAFLSFANAGATATLAIVFISLWLGDRNKRIYTDTRWRPLTVFFVLLPLAFAFAVWTLQYVAQGRAALLSCNSWPDMTRSANRLIATGLMAPCFAVAGLILLMSRERVHSILVRISPVPKNGPLPMPWLGSRSTFAALLGLVVGIPFALLFGVSWHPSRQEWVFIAETTVAVPSMIVLGLGFLRVMNNRTFDLLSSTAGISLILYGFFQFVIPGDPFGRSALTLLIVLGFKLLVAGCVVVSVAIVLKTIQIHIQGIQVTVTNRKSRKDGKTYWVTTWTIPDVCDTLNVFLPDRPYQILRAFAVAKKKEGRKALRIGKHGRRVDNRIIIDRGDLTDIAERISEASGTRKVKYNELFATDNRGFYELLAEEQNVVVEEAAGL